MAEFIVPCSLKTFDIIKYAENNKSIIWKQPKRCTIGDTVFIYVGVPYSKIKYRCSVKNINLESSPLNPAVNVSARNCKYMELFFEQTIENDNLLNLVALQEHGLKTVQCATVVSDKLHSFICQHLSR